MECKMWMFVGLCFASIAVITGEETGANTTLDRTCTSYFGEGWRCSIGGQEECIHISLLCNGYNNCDGGEDEGEVCRGFGENRTCTNPLTGEANRWRCTSGRQHCIPSSYMCDGDNDCDEGEDENLCGGFGEDRTCTNPLTGESVGWRCTSGSKHCIPSHYMCDGDNDCDEGEDENLCGGFGEDRTCTNPLTGEAVGVRCNGSIQQCFRSGELFDGVNQCSNSKYDENNRICIVSKTQKEVGWRCAGDKYISFGALCIGVNWEICNGMVDCMDGIDEQNCPLYTQIGTVQAFAICAGIVMISFLIFHLLRRTQLISTAITKKYEIGGDDDLFYVDKFVDKIRRNKSKDDELKEIYNNIHKSKQIHKLLAAIKIYFIELSTSHEISTIITELEEEIHGSRRQAMLCLRVNGGSNENTERLLSFEADPGFFNKVNKKLTQFFNVILNQNCFQTWLANFPKTKKILSNIPKLMIAFLRVILFLVDTMKDLVLWAILHDKADTNSTGVSGRNLVWSFLFFIFFAQAMVGLFIASNYRTILSIPNDIQVWKKAGILVFMLLSAPVLPSIVIFKATIYSTNISSIIANARNTSDSKASEVLQQVEDLKEKESVHSQIYAYARVIESTLETYPQLNITLSFLVDFILPPHLGNGLGTVLLNTKSISSYVYLVFSPGTILFLISIPYSFILIITSITNLVNNHKRGSLGIKTSAVLGMSYFFQLMSSMVCSIFILVVFQITQQQILLLLFLGNILIVWCFTFVFTRQIVKEFSEASIRQQAFHVLVNTNVTIPYRDAKDENQRNKSFEIFWHMVFRCFINMIMVIIGYFINMIMVIIGYSSYDSFLYDIFIAFFSVLFACPMLQLLGGLLMWIFYKVHPWKEIIDSSLNLCYLPNKLGWRGKNVPEKKLAVEELVVVTSPQNQPPPQNGNNSPLLANTKKYGIIVFQ